MPGAGTVTAAGLNPRSKASIVDLVRELEQVSVRAVEGSRMARLGARSLARAGAGRSRREGARVGPNVHAGASGARAANEEESQDDD